MNKLFALLLLSSIVITGCFLSKPAKVSDGTNAVESQPVLVDEQQGFTLKYTSIPCSELGTYNDVMSDELMQYCVTHFGHDVIPNDALVMAVEQSDDTVLFQRPFDELVNLLGGVDIQALLVTEQLYSDYVANLAETFKISVYLVDDFGRDLIAQWYATKSSVVVSQDDIKYWNVCEAGCPVSDKQVSGEYILWKWLINPSSGAGDMCNSATGPKFDGDEYTRCGLRALLDRSRNLFKVQAK